MNCWIKKYQHQHPRYKGEEIANDLYGSRRNTASGKDPVVDQIKGTCYCPDVYGSGLHHPLLQEGWPSGLRRTPGKCVGANAPPGFESPSLRHKFKFK